MIKFSKHHLGDVVEIILGGTPKTSVAEYWEGGDIPWASVIDFTDSKYISVTQKSITESGLKFSNTKLLSVGDIILSARGTVGKLVVCSCPMTFNQSCYALRSRSNQVLDQNFLYYLLMNLVLEMKQKAVGGVFDTIIKSTLENIVLELPPLSVQQKIASILSAYDDLIENNLKRIKLLEETAQMIYKEWFVNFRFPGYENTKIIDGLPEGWEITTLKEFCSKVTDGTHDTPKAVSNGYRLVTGKNISNGFVDFQSCYQISEKDHIEVMKRSKPEWGDVIFSNIGTLGLSHFVLERFEFSIKNVALLKPKYLYQSSYLYHHLLNEDNLLELSNKASGTSQKFISLDLLRRHRLICPSPNILINFQQITLPFMNQRFSLNSQIRSLQKARDLLLPKLISGEIEV